MAYQQNPYICAAELDGEVCLFHPDTAEYLTLNGTGSAIWNLLEQPANVEQIVAALRQSYAVEEEQCRRETQAFLEEALSRSMLQEVGDP
jgi:hypothetical protein